MNEESWRDRVARMMPLVVALNEAIIATSEPRDHFMTNQGLHGARVAYDPADVMATLHWVAATVAVQSGDYSTARQRKDLARDLEKPFREMCSEANLQLERITGTIPLDEAMALAESRIN